MAGPHIPATSLSDHQGQHVLENASELCLSPKEDSSVLEQVTVKQIELIYKQGLGIGCNFMIDNQLQPTDRLSIIISSSHCCSN